MTETKDIQYSESDVFIQFSKLFKAFCGCCLTTDSEEDPNNNIKSKTDIISDITLVLEEETNKIESNIITTSDEDFVNIDEIEINNANKIKTTTTSKIESNKIGTTYDGIIGTTKIDTTAVNKHEICNNDSVNESKVIHDDCGSIQCEENTVQREESITKMDDTIILSMPDDNYFKD